MTHSETLEVVKCDNCSQSLFPPYIQCRQCSHLTHICINCFRCGAEFHHHESDHSYSVIRDDFPLYDACWTGREEMALLNAVEKCGYGNWSAISQAVASHSASDCERHYNKCYIHQPEPPLPEFPQHHQDIYPCPVVFKLSLNPPRPVEGTELYNLMSGYNAARGEFRNEYKNFVEMDISRLTADGSNMGEDSSDDDDDSHECKELIYESKMALLKSYLMTLRQRTYRKRVVRDYGLIGICNSKAPNARRDDHEVSKVLSRYQVFTTLMSPMQNDKLTEMLLMEHELKGDIGELQLCRCQGLRWLHSVPVFKTLVRSRSTAKQKRHLLEDILGHIQDDNARRSWLQRNLVGSNCASSGSVPRTMLRRQPAPLDVDGEEGNEMLTDAEREVCRTARILPMMFLRMRSVLVDEYNKHGTVTLAAARTLFKIDVNKTRKVYDFCCYSGLIRKSGGALNSG